MKSDPQLDAFEQFRKDAALPPTVSNYTAMKAAWLGALRWAGARSDKDSPGATDPDPGHRAARA